MVDSVFERAIGDEAVVLFRLKEGALTTLCADSSGYSCEEAVMTYQQAYDLHRWLEDAVDQMSDSPANLPSPWETTS